MHPAYNARQVKCYWIFVLSMTPIIIKYCVEEKYIPIILNIWKPNRIYDTQNENMRINKNSENFAFAQVSIKNRLYYHTTNYYVLEIWVLKCVSTTDLKKIFICWMIKNNDIYVYVRTNVVSRYREAPPS